MPSEMLRSTKRISRLARSTGCMRPRKTAAEMPSTSRSRRSSSSRAIFIVESLRGPPDIAGTEHWVLSRGCRYVWPGNTIAFP